MSLLFLTSPAKTLNLADQCLENKIPTSLPVHLKQATEIATHLRKLSVNQLKKVLSVNDSLAHLNFDRLKQWNKNHSSVNSKQALLIYDGAVFRQINKDRLSLKQQTYAQNHVRILSGFYGLLKPYDLIQPYRLEMNNKLGINKDKSLVKFWRKDITSSLNSDIIKNNIRAVINLASKEYSQVIDQSKLSVPFITIDFKEKRDNKLKIIAIYAKQARGAIINYAIENKITDIEVLKKATINGYKFKEQESNGLIFIR
ncbi:MAG: YaaA family protein [Candidatus Pacebacteria bacterium]|nr:YaaA family protein [Candidatus Paceibacterota bacterium]